MYFNTAAYSNSRSGAGRGAALHVRPAGRTHLLVLDTRGTTWAFLTSCPLLLACHDYALTGFLSRSH